MNVVTIEKVSGQVRNDLFAEIRPVWKNNQNILTSSESLEFKISEFLLLKRGIIDRHSFPLEVF